MEESPGSQVVELDLRGVEPPAHILSVLKKAGELPAGAAMRVRLDNNPMQLYDLLQQRGFFLAMSPNSDGTYIALVTPAQGSRQGH